MAGRFLVIAERSVEKGESRPCLTFRTLWPDPAERLPAEYEKKTSAAWNGPIA